MKWQPIETAPIKPFDKEKWFSPSTPRVLVVVGSRVYIAQYSFTGKGKGRWLGNHGQVCNPTHWMPIPEPPGVSNEV